MNTFIQHFRAAIALASTLVITSASGASKETALDRYVAKPDANYSYRLVKTVPAAGWTTYVLEMTSQAWLTTNEVDQPLWKHWLSIVKPKEVTNSKALLMITGGPKDRPAPKSPDEHIIRSAAATKSIVAELRGVPNEPLIFAGETRLRTEDAIIAYTWDKFLRTGDEKWPLRLPMTKSAVRAMDAVTSFCASDEAGKVKIDGFVVTGGSKRGWTTWTTAAVDKRVVAIIPIVIDVLNIEPSFRHHYGAYGFWAPAVHDYSEMHIMDWMGTKENRKLAEIEDPYEYRDRYTMPKFLISAAGDQFFLPDSSQFYFDDLPGVKYLRYVPNADHSLRGSDAAESLLACYSAVLTGAKLPQFSWKIEPAAIRVLAKDKPTEVGLWYATNSKARDFRLENIGPAWQRTPLESDGSGNYVAKIEPPSEGFSAFFVELKFPNPGCPAPFKFTTSVKVLPDKEPFKFEPAGH